MPELERMTLRLDADISDYKRSLAEAEKAAARTAERITATFRDVHRNASQVARGPQAFGVTMRRVATLSGDKRKLSSLRSPTAQPRSISQAADTLAEGPGGDAARRLANVPRQAASASSLLRTAFTTFARIVAVVADIVTFLATGSRLLSNQTGGLDTVVEKQNRLVREQIRRLRKAKGLVDPLAEETEKSENLLSQERERLRIFESRRESARREIEDIKGGGGDRTLDLKTNLDNALFSLKRAEAGIARTSESISLIQEALAAQVAARDSAGAGLSTELERCLQQLCDRLDSFGQDIPFDRAAAGSGNGGQFTFASFDPAGSAFGGAGRDGFDRGLADTGSRVEDLSTGFMKLTQAAGGFETQGGSLAELLARTNLLFGEQSELLGQLTAQAPVLGGELAALFEEGSQEGRVFAEVTDAVGASLLDAFEGAIQRGESLSDVLKGLALDMAEIALKAAGNAFLESILGGLLGGVGGAVSGGGALGPGISPTGGDIFGTPFAKGAAFAPDSAMARNIKAFARGGIVDTPEAFAFADGLGVMGEAGPEAILPLARARSGELGVRAMTGRLPAAPEPAGPTFNIFAPGADREGFREIMALIVRLDGKIDRVARSMPAVAIRAWSEHRRRGGFR